MAKVNFDLKYKDDIIKGSVKAETRDGQPVRIVCWDWSEKYPILGRVDEDCGEPCLWKADGMFFGDEACELDLFVVIEDKEPTAYELLFDNIIAKASCINTDITLETFHKWMDDLKQAAVKDFFDWKYLHDGVFYTKNTAYTFGEYLRVGNYVTDIKKIMDTVPDE